MTEQGVESGPPASPMPAAADATPTPAAPAAPPARPLRRRSVGPFSLRQVTLAIGIVSLAAIVLTLATVPLGSVGPGLPVPNPSAYLLRSPLPGLRPGDLAPDFAGTRDDGTAFQLLDLDGQPIRLANLRGKAVWLNFWASWCPPCQSETPILRTMDQTYRDRGLVLVGIQVQQTVEDGRIYAAKYELGYRIGADVAADVFRTYKVFALPTQFFIDPNGVVRQVVNGPLDETSAAALIESILPAPTPRASTPSPSR
ncbi:MAG TPA: TlpA disulfide reductase family protein [Candidatus Eisenbacteria bacterium]|nr:TlpA disulfide reductase family protein [Candidatus Eisenbacteria bacterium]